MKGGLYKSPRSYGFTIVEVMMFLAISGVMFIVAANFINGKEAQAEYTQGMNSTNAYITTMINNVSNGNYPEPNTSTLNCIMTPSGPTIPTIAPIGASISSGCTFIGLVLQPETNQNPATYTEYLIDGCQFYDSNLSSCTNNLDQIPLLLQDEKPTIVSQMTTSDSWSGGLQIKSMYEVDSSGKETAIGFVGFFASLPTQNGSILASGAQPVSIVTATSNLTDTNKQIQSDIINLRSSDILKNESIVMCFIGTNNDIGSITIGNINGGQQVISDVELGLKVATQCLS